MDALLILIIILLTLGATAVFYAGHRPGPLVVDTAIAAAGFLVIFIAVAFTGVY